MSLLSTSYQSKKTGCKTKLLFSFLFTTCILSFLSSLRLTSSSSMVAAIAGDCNTFVYWHGRKYSISHFLKKKNGKKTKWLSEEALQIAEKMR